MTLFQVSYLLLWIFAILLVPISIVLVYLLAQLETLFKREGLGHGNNLIDRKLPTFDVIDVSSGVVHRFDDVVRGQWHIILAVSAGCGSCASLLKELSSSPIGDIFEIRPLVLCMGELDQCRSAVADLRSVPAYVLNVRDDSTIDLWMAGFPAVLIMDETGLVADVRHPLSIRGLVAAAETAVVNSGHAKSAVTNTATISAGIG